MEKELTIYNMPENVLYQFSDRGYVWKVQRPSTINGSNQSNEPNIYTEVYFKGNDGVVKCLWSGHLINKSEAIPKNKFAIFSYDRDDTSMFGINIPLREAPPEISSQVEIPSTKTR